MSSCCERRFPVCADDIDVNVDNFDTTLGTAPVTVGNAKALVRVLCCKYKSSFNRFNCNS